MKRKKFFTFRSGKRYLKDYIRLAIAFLGCLLAIGVYQQLQLYGQGLLDSFFNQNLLLLWMHHLGFAALAALSFSPIFSGVEYWKTGWGFRAALVLFALLLFNELLLTHYYLQEYALPGPQMGFPYNRDQVVELLILFLAGGVVLTLIFGLLYQQSKKIHRVIGRMFPVTFILLSLFLATLLSDKRPVNVNKNQHLITELYRSWMGEKAYEGDDPYPLWRQQPGQDVLGPHIKWTEQPPNIVVIAVEGLSTSFVGEQAPFRALTPFLNSLREASLYWPHTVANAANSGDALGVLTASLPQGREGFMQQDPAPDRQTLFGLLKKAGYRTSFQYGGNAVLPGWDRFLYEERIDEIVDQKAFGTAYTKQDADAAGISLGYPDHMLFERYLDTRVEGSEPCFDYFQTLSSQPPYSYPRKAFYLDQLDSKIPELDLSPRERRVLRNNEELAAALQYTDESLERFFADLREKEGFQRTLFVITGTHQPAGLAGQGVLESRSVPLMVYSPMLRKKGRMPGVATQLDLTPSLINSLAYRYGWARSDKAAWMSPGLPLGGNRIEGWSVPVYAPHSGAVAWVLGDSLLYDHKAWKIGPDLSLQEVGDLPEKLESAVRNLRAMEAYALAENTLIPPEKVLFSELVAPPGKEELVWIHSVFNGRDFDAAYQTARELAFSGQRERAKSLCRYILMHVPGHVDSEILLARIHAWEKDYSRAQEILELVVQKHPVYADGYAALLDVYFWSGQNEKAGFLLPAIRNQFGEDTRLEQKLQRAGVLLDSTKDNIQAAAQVVQNQFE